MLNFNFTKDFPVNWKSYEFGSGKNSKQARKQGRIEHEKLNPVKIVNFINIFCLFHKIT